MILAFYVAKQECKSLILRENFVYCLDKGGRLECLLAFEFIYAPTTLYFAKIASYCC